MSILAGELQRTIILLNDLSGVCALAKRYIAGQHCAAAAERLKELAKDEEAREERRRKIIEGLLGIIRDGYSAEDLLYVEPHAVRMARKELES